MTECTLRAVAWSSPGNASRSYEDWFDCDPKKQLFDLTQTDLQQAIEGLIPPMIELKCSDASDVSSVQSYESVPLRSIFKSYWERNGGAPALRRISLNDSSFSNQHDYNISYPLDRIKNEAAPPNELNPSTPTTEEKRRSIFQKTKYTSLSTPTLHSSQSSRTKDLQRARSNCVLSSCLRRSSSLCRSPNSDSPSVTFSEDVRVVEFSHPVECWAPKGWSAYFQ